MSIGKYMNMRRFRILPAGYKQYFNPMVRLMQLLDNNNPKIMVYVKPGVKNGSFYLYKAFGEITNDKQCFVGEDIFILNWGIEHIWIFNVKI